jgi:hypothetical protein
VDLTTPDVESASTFYTGLLGWSTTTHETPMGAYTSCSIPSGEVAGMMAPGPGAPTDMAFWSIYLRVTDLDDVLAAATAAGGTTIMGPMEIPGDTRIAVVTDATGAAISLMESADATPWPQGEPGAVVWCEELTRQPGRAIAFHSEVFGWTAEHKEGTTPYTLLWAGDTMVGGLMMMPEMVPAEAPAHWQVYFAVDDCPATCARAEELGGKILVPPTTIDEGRFALLSDPHGAVFGVMDHPSGS